MTPFEEKPENWQSLQHSHYIINNSKTYRLHPMAGVIIKIAVTFIF